MPEKPVTELSVVIPVYGCRECLQALHERLTGVLQRLVRDYEIVYVDDRSPDCAWTTLTDLAASDSRVRAVRLSRNFGQHAAITAGLAKAAGRWVVVMDCDLQDPPESIPRLYAKANEGFDVVYARRKNRHHSGFRRIAAAGYFRLLNVFSGMKLDGEYGSFSVISRKVVDAFLALGDADRHYLLILNWLGFESTSIDIDHEERFAGTSSYTFSRLMKHALDGVMFQTTKLLRWIAYAGFVVAALGVLLAGFLVYSWAVNNPYPGWTSLAVLLLLIGGFVILSLGVTGLYVGKIFSQVKHRPLYVIDEERGSESAPVAHPRVERGTVQTP
jgi:glycosyltransferase involved in cell wall biosynthesis